MAQMANHLLWSLQAIAAGSTATSAPVDISKANALALHLTSLAGAAPDIAFTYTLSNNYDGVYVTGNATITASTGVVDVFDFAPEAAGYIKVIATNNSASTGTVTAQLAVQEL